MKKLFLLAILLCGLTACSSDKDGNSPTPTPKPYGEYYEALQDTVGLTINSVAYGMDYFLYEIIDVQIAMGEKNDYLWLGWFRINESTSKPVLLAEWLNDEKIIPEYTVDLGYGNSQTVKLSEIDPYACTIHSNNTFCWQVRMIYQNNSYGEMKSFLLFVHNNNIYKLDWETSNSSANNLRGKWYDNTYIMYRGSDNSYSCYSAIGEYLITFLEYPYGVPVDMESGVSVHRFSLDGFSAGRSNFITGTNLWSNSIILSDIPANARCDNYELIDSSGDIWTYRVDYTLYSGDKTSRNFTLNIETGEMIEEL